jgi:Zn ribbon nucleic-acid-binding protein
MPACEHKRTEFLMRRDAVEYVHCVECGQVFESDDLEQISIYDETEEEPRQKKAS